MKNQFSDESKVPPEIAFYYPGQYLSDPDWAKNLILFFDGIGMLIPNYMKNHSRLDDLAIITGLKEHGLFHVIEPETAIDKDATLNLVSIMTDIIASGALDELNNEATAFGSISMSRLGFKGDRELAQMIFEELKSRGLAKDTEDGGHSIPIHKTIRSLILVLLAHILRAQGKKRGLDLSPATDRSDIVKALGEFVSVSSTPTIPALNDIVAFDMNTVGVDLRLVPIDEVLAFREEHYPEYRKYSLCVRTFVRELSCMESKERNQAFGERQEELESLANDLSKLMPRTWEKFVPFGLGLIGAAWNLAQDNWFAAAITAATGMSATLGKIDTGAYSYLFSARSRFG
jgi:hypothetical protein